MKTAGVHPGQKKPAKTDIICIAQPYSLQAGSHGFPPAASLKKQSRSWVTRLSGWMQVILREYVFPLYPFIAL